MSKLFSPAKLGSLTLSNHLVMAPMTRSRAISNLPNALIAEYYAQRAGAGLIITEGTAPSPNGLGYPRIPGIFSAEQVAGWKLVTEAVHAKGGRIFVQLMHTGRVSHLANMPEGAEVVAPSAVLLEGDMYTDQYGPQPHSTPRAMEAADILHVIAEHVQAAKNAIAAGFDGVELHGANGYLIEQFLAPNTNTRTDQYGGSIENRTRFALEVTAAVVKAIGAERVGIRLSPDGVFNGIQPYPAEQALYLAEKLNELGIGYLHLVDHGPMGAPQVNAETVSGIRTAFKGTLILSGGYDVARAEEVLQSGKADLVAFGRPFLANPDLVERLRQGAALNPIDFGTFYTPGEKGFTDYPTLATATA